MNLTQGNWFIDWALTSCGGGVPRILIQRIGQRTDNNTDMYALYCPHNYSASTSAVVMNFKRSSTLISMKFCDVGKILKDNLR